MVFRNKIPSSLFETTLSHTTLSNMICVKSSNFKHFRPGGTQLEDFFPEMDLVKTLNSFFEVKI